MADRSSKKEFGKRRPAAEKPPSGPPVKRSGHVALLVMGTLAVGTTAYTLMPRQTCEPTPGAVPGQTTTTCTTSSSSSSSGSGSSSRWSSRSSLFSSDSSSHSSSATSSDSGHSSVSRGGFGSFGHGFSGGG
ncbi:hypothetical protein C7U92_31785 [Bradyrhizobium sp. WBOS7]|uniref:Uncharacterized protein n=1 Tax=Bradyrhizobium betae TaxID=244734 RepID=A0AAE9SP27_9BRAD|nr:MULTISPECIES: hypothetical protein [Bradyrhizobium]MDD1572819.1 hypothetical protein [Bradyrhizobium sp. WBOS1]UUO33311.1 hypothetical protein DCK84_01065 [Bradyrhizobium sp. WBOS01]MDD1531824.1 hypothetical protein [Bradyrhizobium sp. WBOS2]MDD1581269.1 hypothetical protein [Bradyrhizobium sp. WBOS7]MDD1604997.1 hypothetical protein [Bradyrhizobium sp. WBOS16]